MTLAEACTRVAQFARLDLDLYFGEKSGAMDPASSAFAPADADMRTLVNWGIRAVAWRIRPYDPQIGLTIVAGTSRYSLHDRSVVTKRVIRPYRVYQRNNKGYFRGRTGRGLMQMSEFQNHFSGWQDQPAGSSTRVVYLGPATNEILLWPTPDAAYITSFGGVTPQLYVEGTCLPNDMATDSADDANELPLPYQLHEAACFAAAVKGRLSSATEESAWRSLSAFSAEWEGLATEVERLQSNALVGDLSEYGYECEVMDLN